ncbi:hypothetical protein [Clostridium tagluense]|uniref:Uncharacterized protein n=1 Tax=Clostridium tagluense TaxID=360422 RepID=A0A401UQC7_9CLOT|nr:hypothetical protein [Clostridium tagluense]GCD11745.1 hypothetical protein Ctaglu_33680 [Clostridium tagluense]
MWIRSQQNQTLIKTKSISIRASVGGTVSIVDINTNIQLGFYKTGTRAMEVLNEFENFIITQSRMLNNQDKYNIELIEYVYKMPQ